VALTAPHRRPRVLVLLSRPTTTTNARPSVLTTADIIVLYDSDWYVASRVHEW
jgi:hypothetical protein